jgi:predicted permease
MRSSWYASVLDWFSRRRRQRREDDLRRELRTHLELEEEEQSEAGISDEEAHRTARRSFGNPAVVMENTRAAWGWAALDRLAQDLRFGLRTLRKDIGYSLLAISILAAGIGANTAIFTIVNAALLRPLPFQDPSRLVNVFHTAPPNVMGAREPFGVAVGNFVDWRSHQEVFEGMGLYRFHGLNLTGGERPDFLPGAEVSADFFSVLRMKPVLGRTFTAAEMEPGNDREIILSYAVWQSYFGGNHTVVGQTFSFDRQNYTVIGVMPEEFRFPGWAKVWVPAAWREQERANRTNHSSMVVARLKPNASVERAQAEMDAISRRLEAAYPKENAGWGAWVVSLHENLISDLRTSLLVLLGAVGFVLLIACSNVANLVLAKTLTRRKEIAIRGALGSTRGRVLQLVLAETVTLALGGGVLGVLLARFGVRLMIAYLGDRLPASIAIHIDATVLLFAFLLSVTCGILAGLLPALRFTRTDTSLHDALQQGLDRTDSTSLRMGSRNILVIAEVALCMVLLIGAGLLLRTVWVLQHTNAGIDPRNVLTMDLPRPPAPGAGNQAFIQQVLERLRALPGIDSAAATSNVPLSGSNESTWSVQIEGQPSLPIAQQPAVATNVVTPGFFSTLRIPILRGRDFTTADSEDRPRVVIVSEAMAYRFWPNQDAIGKRLFVSWTEPAKPREVVGIVANTREHGLESTRPLEEMYVPDSQSPFFSESLVLRTSSAPLETVAPAARAIHQIDRQQPLVRVAPLAEVIAQSYSDRRFNMLLLMGFAALALLLAAVGIYAVLSYSVRQRLREIGIRMALGARTVDVLWMVLVEGMRPAVLGMAFGVAGALAMRRVLAGIVFGVPATDPITFVAVITLLAGIALLSCIVPAFRATKVHPLEVLRGE